MGRLDKIIDMETATQQATNDEVVAGELERLDGRPSTIPQHVWDMIRDNGELATTRLNELLRSPRFSRFKPADQAKLIALAQDRAYGKPVAVKQEASAGRKGARDAVQTELDSMVYRAQLPEYKKT